MFGSPPHVTPHYLLDESATTAWRVLHKVESVSLYRVMEGLTAVAPATSPPLILSSSPRLLPVYLLTLPSSLPPSLVVTGHHTKKQPAVQFYGFVSFTYSYFAYFCITNSYLSLCFYPKFLILPILYFPICLYLLFKIVCFAYSSFAKFRLL